MIVAGGLKLMSNAAGGGQGGPGGPGGGPQAAQGGGGPRVPGGPRGPGGRGGGFGGGPAQVTMATVQQRQFTDAVEVLGVAKGRQSVTITAAATQLVERVH